MVDTGRRWAVQVLGALAVGPPGDEVPIGSARQRAVLARLVAAGGGPVSPYALIEAAWGEHPPRNSKGALQTQVSRLRTTLGASPGSGLRQDPAGYRLTVEPDRVDAWHFEQLVTASREPSAQWERRSLLERADVVWRGDPYLDVDDPSVEVHARFLRRLRRRAVGDLVEAYLDDGELLAAVSRAEALAAADPLDERAAGLLMRALHASGDSPLALAAFQDHRRALAEDLGLEPSPALRALEQGILGHEPALGVPDRPRRPRPRPPVSRLVGRRHELEVALRLLESARIVTLTGPGGVGKTRLALHLCELVAERFPGGVWLCDLASASPENIDRVVAESLGVHDRAGEQLQDRVVAVLATGRTLLVLDNCEHLGPAIAQLVDHLARRAPSLVILATSHQHLGVDGEHQLRLRGLPTPAGDEASEAGELFCDRARAVDPEFDPDRDPGAVAALTRALGGIPLALELAASATRHTAVEELAMAVRQRLDVLDETTPHSPTRHRSLQAILESSISRLDDETSATLHRLAVFAGRFGQPLAEALLAESGTEEPTAVQMRALVAASLVQHSRGGHSGHFELLSPIRTICRQRLSSTGDLDTVQRGHARVVSEAAARLDEDLRSSQESSAHSGFEQLVPDLRAAREWLRSNGTTEAVAGLCVTTCWFTMLRTRSELTRWCEEAMAHVDRGSLAFARLAASAAVGASKRGDLAEAGALARAAADQGHAHARFGIEVLGQISLYEGRLEDALDLGARAVAAHRDSGHEVFAVNAETIGVAALVYLSRPGEARAAAAEVLRAATAAEAPSVLAMAHYFAGEAAADLAEACDHYRRSIEIAEAVGADFAAGLAATSLCAREVRSGSSTPAVARLPGVLRHWQRGGVGNQQWLVLRLVVEALSAVGDHDGVAVLTGALAGSTQAGPVYGEDAERLARAIERAGSGLGTERFEEHNARGRLLDGDGAVQEAVRRCRASAE